MRTWLIFGCLALSCAWMPLGRASPPTTGPAPAASTSLHPIRSKSDLARYLRQTPANSPPLGWLSPGGRKRFLAQLKFGHDGLGGFSFDDPARELTHAQIVQLFTLFGAESYAHGLGLTERKHARFERERQADARTRGCPVASCPESAIEQRYDKLILAPRDASLSDIQRSARIGQRYDHLFAVYQTPKKLRTVSDLDLRLLKRAAKNVVFFVPDGEHTAQLKMDLAEMQRRGIADDKDFTALYRARVASRQFAMANTLAKQYPGMAVDPLPALRKSTALPPGQPTALTVAADGHTMTRQAFDLSTPLRIVVVASCHFSQDAARAIKADPPLRALFAKHAIWLANQTEAFANAQQWNQDFPKQPIHIAWDNSEWKQLDDWGMPTFYVFRHGKLVDKWNGWPADTGMQTLRQHLRKVGVL